MENILESINSLLPNGIKVESYLLYALVLVAAVVIFGLIGRVLFGKKSVLSQAVSSAISILFIYAVTIVVISLGADLHFLIAPLPFITINGEYMNIFHFEGVHYTLICEQVLSMIILAFLVNLADGWLPKGKNIFSWLFFRVLTVLIGYILHLVVVGLFATYLPEGIVTYAPVILLVLLVLLLLTGALKIVVGALLTTVNPIIGGLYTFFFATIIGKQITKAVLTTLILSALVIGLQYIGFSVISIASAALMASIPMLILLIVLWYIVIKVF